MCTALTNPDLLHAELLSIEFAQTRNEGTLSTAVKEVTFWRQEMFWACTVSLIFICAHPFVMAVEYQAAATREVLNLAQLIVSGP